VVIDLSWEGQRCTGGRAGALVHALADRLGEHLPSGARVRHDHGDALSVVLPGWTRSPATEWMYRTLPGMFEDFDPHENVPGVYVRATVHDSDGPVGAQLLQAIDRPRRAHGGDPRSAGSQPVAGSREQAGSAWRSPPPESATARPAAGGRRHRRGSQHLSDPAATGADQRHDLPRPPIEAEQSDPTEGLGLADLLAGALAAYRAI
jgi:hypothetical protein